jgi:hypothetical protein
MSQSPNLSLCFESGQCQAERLMNIWNETGMNYVKIVEA